MNTLLVDQETSKSSEILKETQRKTEPLYIDVRTPHEFETVHIEGALNFPLQDLSSRMGELKRLMERRSIIVLCRTQNRAKQACEIFANHGLKNCTILPGGMTEWLNQGKPVKRGQHRMSIEGQVRVVAGTLVLLGVGIGVFFQPGFLIIPALVGAGLLHAGLTDSCLMGIWLTKLPSNRIKPEMK